MEYGTVPDWLGGIGTTGALLTSLYLLREDRRFRASAQASRISVWAEWKRTPGGHDATPRQFFVYVDNASDAPVYVNSVRVSRREGEDSLLDIEFATVPAHHIEDYGLDEIDFPPQAEVPYIEATFLDVDRVRWRRTSRAVLQRDGGPTP